MYSVYQATLTVLPETEAETALFEHFGGPYFRERSSGMCEPVAITKAITPAAANELNDANRYYSVLLAQLVQ